MTGYDFRGQSFFVEIALDGIEFVTVTRTLGGMSIIIVVHEDTKSVAELEARLYNAALTVHDKLAEREVARGSSGTGNDD